MLIVLVIVLAIVGLFLVGGLVLGLALKLLWWALIGLVIGGVARLLIPGTQAIGWLTTILCGLGGALLGGIVARALDAGSIVQFIIAVLVAAVLIAVIGGGRRAEA
jgi:uncharacterized membrane protein YeaQ/YmgE (transglycosylase-associated protein family)